MASADVIVNSLKELAGNKELDRYDDNLCNEIKSKLDQSLKDNEIVGHERALFVSAFQLNKKYLYKKQLILSKKFIFKGRQELLGYGQMGASFSSGRKPMLERVLQVEVVVGSTLRSTFPESEPSEELLRQFC